LTGRDETRRSVQRVRPVRDLPAVGDPIAVGGALVAVRDPEGHAPEVIERARIRRLEIEELVVDRLVVREQVRSTPSTD